jgi:hypothetical protein
LTEESFIAPETLAALLDGTLSPEQREDVLRQLSRSGQAYEDFLEASAVRCQLDESVEVGDEGLLTPSVTDVEIGSIDNVTLAIDPPSLGPEPGKEIRSRSRWNLWRARSLWTAVPLIAAAGIASVVFLRETDERPALSILREFPATSSAIHGGHPDWGSTRGEEHLLSPDRRAFRLGVLIAALDQAVRASDTDDAAGIVTRLRSLVAAVPAGGVVLARLNRFTTPGLDGFDAQDRIRMASELRTLSESTTWFDLGVWSETARVAARADRRDFFDPSGAPMRSLSRIIATLDAAPKGEQGVAVQEVDRLRRLLRQPMVSSEELDALVAALDSTIVESGGG